MIDSILSGNVDQHVINAKELYLKVSEHLPLVFTGPDRMFGQ